MVSGLLTSAPFPNRRHPQLQRATEYSLSGRNPGCVEMASNRAEFRADTARFRPSARRYGRGPSCKESKRSMGGRSSRCKKEDRARFCSVAQEPIILTNAAPSGPLRHRTESGGRGRRRQGYFCKQVLRTTDGLAWHEKRSCDAQCCYAIAAAASAVASTV
jgi:hypothetical protein